MDQFRGYTVAGMFLVNFLGGYAAIHPVLKHNNKYFSYADSIMPSFMFAVGFSFRLTYLRRRSQSSGCTTVWTYVPRSLALVVVSLVMYGFGGHFKRLARCSTEMPAEFEPFRAKATQTHSFDELVKAARAANPQADDRTVLALASSMGARILPLQSAQAEKGKAGAAAERAAAIADQEESDFVTAAQQRIQNWNALSANQRMLVHLRIAVAKLIKSDLWETLAIIGVTQLVVLPFIGWSFAGRFAAIVGLGAVASADFLVVQLGFSFTRSTTTGWRRCG